MTKTYLILKDFERVITFVGINHFAVIIYPWHLTVLYSNQRRVLEQWFTQNISFDEQTRDEILGFWLKLPFGEAG